MMHWLSILVLALVGLKWVTQLWLERLNERNVRAHAGAVPDAFQGVVDPPTYAKTIEYTLAKGQLRKSELTYDAVVLVVVLFCGLLPWTFEFFRARLGGAPLAMAELLLSA